jgi:fatty acid desaturase
MKMQDAKNQEQYLDEVKQRLFNKTAAFAGIFGSVAAISIAMFALIVASSGALGLKWYLAMFIVYMGSLCVFAWALIKHDTFS